MSVELNLTTAELREITGYTYGAHQQVWLRDHGFKFHVNRASNRPVVSRNHYEIKSGGVPKVQRDDEDRQFNWDAITKRRSK